MGVYVPSINNKFKGRMKYGKDFLDMLEKEIAGGLPSAFPTKKHNPNSIPVLTSPEYHGNGAIFEIEGKIYNSKVSSVMSISNEEGGIGSCYKLMLGERKSQDEIIDIMTNNGIKLSDNSMIRYFQMQNYAKIRDPDCVWRLHLKTSERKLLEEINTPKRVAYFTVIQEEDEDCIPTHEGQKIVPKRLTDTKMFFCGDGGYPYEFFAYGKDELKKYPIVEIW